MHIDEGKKFDKRNIERNLKEGIITQKEYELYLSRLPDVSDKIYIPEELTEEAEEYSSGKESESQSKRKGGKKKVKK